MVVWCRDKHGDKCDGGDLYMSLFNPYFHLRYMTKWHSFSTTTRSIVMKLSTYTEHHHSRRLKPSYIYTDVYSPSITRLNIENTKFWLKTHFLSNKCLTNTDNTLSTDVSTSQSMKWINTLMWQQSISKTSHKRPRTNECAIVRWVVFKVRTLGHVLGNERRV